MKDAGMYAAPAKMLRKRKHDEVALEFMWKHDGFEKDDWLIVQ